MTSIERQYQDEIDELKAQRAKLIALVRGYRTTYPLDSYADKADELLEEMEG
jgi:hypothetical protein